MVSPPRGASTCRANLTPPSHGHIVIEEPTRHSAFTDWGMSMRDLSVGKNAPNFSEWQYCPISFLELADDARICYSFNAAYTQDRDVDG